jgi:hypothetical protein
VQSTDHQHRKCLGFCFVFVFPKTNDNNSLNEYALGRVLLLSRTNYNESLLWARDLLCNWTEPDVNQIDVKRCIYTVNNRSVSESGTIYRPETTHDEYGPLMGADRYQLNATTLPPLVACGVNIPSPDSLTPQLLQAQIWSVAPNVDITGAACATMDQHTGPRWQVLLSRNECNKLPVIQTPRNAVENLRLWKQINGTVNVYSFNVTNKR